MLDSFGARLRRRRDEQKIDLATIAEQTKIKLSLLEALERDDVSHWPSGIFRRAFIRSYAHAIGLSPDVVVREFLEIYPEPVESAETELTAGARPPTRLHYLVGSAMGSLSRLRRSAAGEEPATPASAVLPVGPHPSPESPAQTEVAATADNVLASVEASDGCDFMAVADLCTEVGRVENIEQMQPLLQRAADILDAIGLVVWVWDPSAAELRPALAHGYSEQVLAQLPAVRRDDRNATAAAFRSAQACAIDGSAHASGALVVPLLTSTGCAGVLAMELPPGSKQPDAIRAVATIFAAMLAQLPGIGRPADIRPPVEMIVPEAVNYGTRMLRAERR